MVNIDTVYQTVQALANKEQRGYITPQEFNLFANTAQMQIFEQYFYDLHQFKRIPGDQSSYSDMVNIIEDKLVRFLSKVDGVDSTNGIALPSDFYRDQTVSVDGQRAEKTNRPQQNYYTNPNLKLLNPTKSRPIYYILQDGLTVNPSGVVNFSYIRKPSNPKWTYTIVNEAALYNPTASDHNHFELHDSEQSLLISKILKMAGLSIEDQAVTQAAAVSEQITIQQQKS
jgi:hypothetical protein